MLYIMLDSSGFGGIESHVLQLSLLLHQKKVPFKVVFLSDVQAHPLHYLLNDHDIDYISVVHFTDFIALISSNDVLHAHGYKSSLWARIIKVLCRCQVVTSFHAGEMLTGKLAFYEWLNGITSFLSINFAVSDEIRSRLPFHCALLNNFIHTIPSLSSRHRHDVLQVGFVGRLCDVKGLDRYLALSKDCGMVKFHVFGDGECRDLFSHYPDVKWHGAVKNMMSYWNELDLLVIPSRAEGLPMAALEAMSHGVPVIGTNVGALSSLVEPRWLVESQDWCLLSQHIHTFSAMTKDEWLGCSHYSHAKVVAEFNGEKYWPILAKAYGYEFMVR